MIFPLGSNKPYQIPVPPETISGGTGSIVQTFELISIGEVISQGGIQLEKFKWESHFPYRYDPSIEVIPESEHIQPLVWYKNITQSQKNQSPVRITIQNTPIDFKAIITAFRWSYVPGIYGDMWYQIELTQHKQGAIREFDGISLPLLNTREDSTPPKSNVDVVFPTDSNGNTVTTYTTREGDTFEKISFLLFGSSRFARNIYDHNKIMTDSMVKKAGIIRWTFGDKLPAGIRLTIPAVPGFRVPVVPSTSG